MLRTQEAPLKIMKKLLFLKLLVLVACLSSALTLSADDYDFVADRLAYKITGTTTVEVANPGGEAKASDIDYSGVINIPRTVTNNGTTYTVTGIGLNAFAGSSVTQVIIPNSVTYIDEYAFYLCWDLTSVSIGSGVRTIGDFAFCFCENLRYVICRATTPPTVYECTFKIMSGSGLGLDFVQLYVPSSAYWSSAYWNQFGNISSIPSLKNALTTNSIEFTSSGSYPWMVMADVGGLYAMSGNGGVHSSTSTLTATVTVPTGEASLSFDFKAWGEGSSYDKCIFSVDGTQQFSYGARDNDWESYTVQLTAGTHTLSWTYSKDGSVNPKGDYFAVRNVKLNKEPYAVYTSSNTTLTFYYDGLRSSRTGTTYDLNTDSNYPGWYTDSTCHSVTKVVFNSSFANARPTSTYLWFGHMGNLTSITGLSYLNTENVTNMFAMFYECTGLTSLNLSNFNTANVTDMASMFYGCTGLTSLNVSSFNTANVTRMGYMFSGCTGLTSLNLSSFNTAKVTDMISMFRGCTGLTSLNLSTFNTVKVPSMEHMFRDCTGLTTLDLSSFNTANVTSMRSVFEGCTGLTSLDLSSFNTANVTNMGYMFYNCSNLKTIYAGNGWTTNAVTTSTSMFLNCTKLVGGQGTTYSSSHVDKAYAHIDGGTSNPGYFSEWKEAYACYTPSNTTLSFYYDGQRSSRTGTTYDLNTGVNDPVWYTDSTCRSVTKVVFNSSFANARPTSTRSWFAMMKNLTSITGLSYLNTENVTNMRAMFSNSSSLTSLNLSHFNTAKVTNMYDMFWNCTGLTSLNVSSFNTSNVTTMSYMFGNCSSLTSLDLSSFNTANVKNLGYVFMGCSGLTGLDLSNFNTAKVTSMYYMFRNCSNLKTVYAGSGWTTNAVTSSTQMFYNCTKLVGGMGTTYDANHVDAAYAHIDGGPSNPGYLTEWKEAYACYTPSNTTLTFYYDNQRSSRTGTTYDLNTGDGDPGWYTDGTKANVTKVVFNSSFANARPTSAKRWFSGMENLVSITGLSYLNTSEVTNMMSMFFNCNKLTSLDLSSFNTAKVTNMSFMFQKCTGLTSLNVSSFNTSEVTTMSYMFEYCSGLTSLDLGSFNTSNVTGMGYMFRYCSGLTSLDLSSFNTAKVAYMQGMFQVSSKLKTIYVGNGWTTNAVTNSTSMFTYCTKLVGGMGTTYDANHVDAAYAHIDGGTSNPGYFTNKNAILRGDVNCDGSVTIADVTALIDYLLTSNPSGVDQLAADCNGDGSVTIADVTALIDFLLSSPEYYIVGSDPFGGWNPNAGVKMAKNADGSYSYTATVDGVIWFVFSSGLDSSWDVFNTQYRYGPISGTDETVEANVLKNTQRMIYGINGDKAYKFVGTGGEYVFTFIPDAGISPTTAKFMIVGDVDVQPFTTFTVAGVPASVFGTEWDCYNTSNEMTLTSSGVYELIKYNCLLNAGTSVESKVVANHDWNYAWPLSNNISLSINTTGYYNLKFTFDPNTGSCSVQIL